MIGYGVRHNTATRAERKMPALNQHAPDQYIQIHVSITAKVTHRTGIIAPSFAFQFRNDLHAPDFRTTGDRSSREYRPDGVDRAGVAKQLATHI